MALKLKKTKYPGIKVDEKGCYWVDVYLSGRRRKRTRCGNLVDARAYMASLLDKDRRSKLFPEESLSSKRLNLSLADLMDRYEDEVKSEVKPKTWASYANSDKHLRKFFGELPILSIDAESCREFRRSRLRKDRAKPNSVNRDLERLRLLFNKADRDRLISRSPLLGHRIMATPDGRVRWLTKEELAALKTACLANDPELWPLIVFAFLTGVRAREQWSLTWQKVLLPEDPKSPGFLIVPRPKTSTKDHLPIRKTVRSILEAQRGKSLYWVFPNQSGTNRIDHDNLTDRRFRPILRIAGIQNFSWHDLRHHFCSSLAMAGEDIQVIRALAGHSSISTTMKYSHLSPGYLSKSLDAIEDPDLLSSV